MPDYVQHLVTNFRRWFEEIKRLITTVDQAERVTTTRKINGFSKQNLLDIVRNALNLHLSKTNPHRDDHRYLNIISKEEWADIKNNLVDLLDVPVASIPLITGITYTAATDRLNIPAVRVMFRGLYYDLPPSVIQMPTRRVSNNLGFTVTYNAPLDKFEFTPQCQETIIGGTMPLDVFLLFGRVTYAAATGWTATTFQSNVLIEATVGTTPMGRRVPVSTGIPAQANYVDNTWKT